MRDQLIALLAETSAVDLPDTEAAEVFRIAWLGRKGRMKDLMAAFKEAPNEEKRELGKLLNELKGSIEERIESVASQGAGQSGSGSSGEDLTRPAGGRGGACAESHGALTRGSLCQARLEALADARCLHCATHRRGGGPHPRRTSPSK